MPATILVSPGDRCLGPFAASKIVFSGTLATRCALACRESLTKALCLAPSDSPVFSDPSHHLRARRVSGIIFVLPRDQQGDDVSPVNQFQGIGSREPRQVTEGATITRRSREVRRGLLANPRQAVRPAGVRSLLPNPGWPTSIRKFRQLNQ